MAGFHFSWIYGNTSLTENILDSFFWIIVWHAASNSRYFQTFSTRTLFICSAFSLQNTVLCRQIIFYFPFKKKSWDSIFVNLSLKEVSSAFTFDNVLSKLVSGQLPPEENCPLVRIGVWVKIRVTFRGKLFLEGNCLVAPQL